MTDTVETTAPGGGDGFDHGFGITRGQQGKLPLFQKWCLGVQFALGF